MVPRDVNPSVSFSGIMDDMTCSGNDLGDTGGELCGPVDGAVQNESG